MLFGSYGTTPFIFTFPCQILLLRSLVLDHTHLGPHVIVSVVNLKFHFHEQFFMSNGLFVYKANLNHIG